ncbi:hypothetical protein R5R35_006400 [Gryllus longicercus]|uniref:Beta-galactosidase n=1 Tax=Gryllus longicercus TaxID=2509291 RepID=A0AAN9W015_9ORTH
MLYACCPGRRRFRPLFRRVSPAAAVGLGLLCGLLLLYLIFAYATRLPTLYEFYTSGGVTEGLEAENRQFTLNGRPLSLFSGALHYFRVPPALWRDRLRRMRAAGLVAVETYVPWNLHNPAPGVYDFGDGGTAWSPFLDIVGFLRAAQEEDLVALVRPGPYICAEWEFGGLPSWLLRDPNMRVRTSYEPYKEAVRAYFERLLPLLAPLHFTRGGPVVGLQIENEYGSLGVDDKPYLEFIKGLMQSADLPGLFFTSDSPLASGDRGALPGVLQTANFQVDPEKQLNALERLQPGKPAMVMEYWTGWFDHWTEEHHTTTLEAFSDVLRRILEYPSGVNFYMFHGGTNWGFMNGANSDTSFPTYQPDITSYDYDAPLTEWGNYTPKYEAVKRLLAQHAAVELRTPSAPAAPARGLPAGAAAPLAARLPLGALAAAVPPALRASHAQPLPMELLPANGGAGQSYGFLLYRRAAGGEPVPDGATLTVRGRVRDLAVVLLDGQRVSAPLTSLQDLRGFGYWEKENASLQLRTPGAAPAQSLELLVENWGRVNFGSPDDFHQRKGLLGSVELDGATVAGWDHLSLQFDPAFLAGLSEWQPVALDSPDGVLATPTLFRVEVSIDEPVDTWIDVRGWSKGIVFVNGFALGRYLHLGPSHTLYWPAPLQRKGLNEVLVFELFQIPSDTTLRFSDAPDLD